VPVDGLDDASGGHADDIFSMKDMNEI